MENTMVSNKISIDFSNWMTMKNYADKEKIIIPSVMGRIAAGKLKTWHIEEISMTLVEAKSENKRIVEIDFSEWQSVKNYSKQEGISIDAALKRVKYGKIKTQRIQELNNLMLVKIEH